MDLDKIKTYDQLDNMLFDIDYDTLSFEDIKKLCDKVWEIFEEIKTKILESEEDPDLRGILITAEENIANTKCQKIRDYLEKRMIAFRRRKKMQEVETMDDIKDYEGLDAYCEKVGYENLTDEDIDNLIKIVWKICGAQDEETRSHKTLHPAAAMMICSFHRSVAVSRIDFLRNCTEERRRANNFRKMREADRRAGGIIRDDYLLTPRERAWERTLIHGQNEKKNE